MGRTHELLHLLRVEGERVLDAGGLQLLAEGAHARPVGGRLHSRLGREVLAVDRHVGVGVPGHAVGYVVDDRVLPDHREEVIRLSRICHENALELFRVIETEYNRLNARKMTLRNLGQVITIPRSVDPGVGIHYDLTQSPSTFIQNNLENLIRLNPLV